MKSIIKKGYEKVKSVAKDLKLGKRTNGRGARMKKLRAEGKK